MFWDSNNVKMKLKGTSDVMQRGEIQPRPEKRKSSIFLEAAPDPTIVVNSVGQMAHLNHLAEKLFGYARHDVLGKEIDMLIPGLSRTLSGDGIDFFQDPKAFRVDADFGLRGEKNNGLKFAVDMSLNALPKRTS